MPHATEHDPRRSAIPAAVTAALLLAGCSSGNIGESWQCPLAEGGSCDSVAAADPAVPDRQATGGSMLGEPLWRVQDDRPPQAPAETPCEAGCGAGFDPFGWLLRLFGADGGERGPRSADPAASMPTPPAKTEVRPAEPATAGLPAAPDSAGGYPEGDDLRTDEVVARIWIAPFVDADGVYREASHVRVVLDPARWRVR